MLAADQFVVGQRKLVGPVTPDGEARANRDLFDGTSVEIEPLQDRHPGFFQLRRALHTEDRLEHVPGQDGGCHRHYDHSHENAVIDQPNR